MKFSVLGTGNLNADVILDLPAVVIPKLKGDKGDTGDLTPESQEVLDQAVVEANQARDAAQQAAGRYPTASEGVSATQVGDYFTTPSDNPRIASVLYRNTNNTVEGLEVVTTYPSYQSVPYFVNTDEDLFFAVADSEGYASAVSARVTDGMFPEFVMDNIRSRIPQIPEPVRKLTDMSKFSVWGASDIFNGRSIYQELAEELDTTFFDGSDSGQRIASIMGSQGSRDILVQFPNNTIPAVSNEITNLTWLNGTNYGGIDQRRVLVEGTNIEGLWRGTRFTRLGVVPGVSQPIVLDGPVRLITRVGIEQQDGFQIWAVGRNDVVLGGTLEDLIDATDDAYNKHPTTDKRVLIQGHWLQTDNGLSQPSKAMILAYNDYCRSKYGEKFLDISAYLTSSQVWLDIGVTPTSQDLTAQGLGNPPPSLFSDAVHPNALGYTAITQYFIKPRLLALGWY